MKTDSQASKKNTNDVVSLDRCLTYPVRSYFFAVVHVPTLGGEEIKCCMSSVLIQFADPILPRRFVPFSVVNIYLPNKFLIRVTTKWREAKSYTPQAIWYPKIAVKVNGALCLTQVAADTVIAS